MGNRKGRPIGQCRLCLQVRPLCDSHLFPRGMYDTFRDLSDPKHVFLTPKRVIRTTQQIHAYLLCETCEERFNSHGERWVLRNCLKASGEFALRDALRAAKPSNTFDTARTYPGHTLGVDIDRLVYFATSLLWRAAVHDWSAKYGLGKKLNLGTYEEEIRNFLLGLNEFPQNGCVIVYVSDDDTPYAGATSPVGIRTNENYFQYSFHIPERCFFFS